MNQCNLNCMLSQSHGVVGNLVHKMMEHVLQESEMGEREVCEGHEVIAPVCMLGARTETACWLSLLIVVSEPPLCSYHASDHTTSSPFP